MYGYAKEGEWDRGGVVGREREKESERGREKAS